MAYLLKQSDKEFAAKFEKLLGIKREASADVNDIVSDILTQIRQKKDQALLDLTNKFDRCSAKSPEDLKVSAEEIKKAVNTCDEDTLAALQLAADRIKAHHEKQKPEDQRYKDPIGVELGYKWSAVDSAGLYVPGGTAAYPSSVLMNAIPAKIAGVDRLVMAVPAPDGVINPLVLVAANLCGVSEIYKIGGAQAIGALAYGTDMIKSVDVIVGPGNVFVACAKRHVFGTVGIDMIAGPSEVLIIADKDNNPDWIAADLLAQAEHDTAAQSILISDDETFLTAVDRSVSEQLKTLPRADIASKSWDDFGALIHVNHIDEAVPLANRIAAEHLELAVADPDRLFANIKHAGAVFLGAYTPEAIGDYVGGSNHVLPTARSARFSSGLSVLDFMKKTTLLKCGPKQLSAIGPAAIKLAEVEGLDAHGHSVALRLNAPKNASESE